MALPMANLPAPIDADGAWCPIGLALDGLGAIRVW